MNANETLAAAIKEIARLRRAERRMLYTAWIMWGIIVASGIIGLVLALKR